eukprot:jgi/Mesvir1/23911/Mv10689-RA.1
MKGTTQKSFDPAQLGPIPRYRERPVPALLSAIIDLAHVQAERIRKEAGKTYYSPSKDATDVSNARPYSGTPGADQVWRPESPLYLEFQRRLADSKAVLAAGMAAYIETWRDAAGVGMPSPRRRTTGDVAVTPSGWDRSGMTTPSGAPSMWGGQSPRDMRGMPPQSPGPSGGPSTTPRRPLSGEPYSNHGVPPAAIDATASPPRPTTAPSTSPYHSPRPGSGRRIFERAGVDGVPAVTPPASPAPMLHSPRNYSPMSSTGGGTTSRMAVVAGLELTCMQLVNEGDQAAVSNAGPPVPSSRNPYLPYVRGPIEMLFEFYSLQQEKESHVKQTVLNDAKREVDITVALKSFCQLMEDFKVLPQLVSRRDIITAFRSSLPHTQHNQMSDKMAPTFVPGLDTHAFVHAFVRVALLAFASDGASSTQATKISKLMAWMGLKKDVDDLSLKLLGLKAGLRKNDLEKKWLHAEKNAHGSHYHGGGAEEKAQMWAQLGIPGCIPAQLVAAATRFESPEGKFYGMGGATSDPPGTIDLHTWVAHGTPTVFHGLPEEKPSGHRCATPQSPARRQVRAPRQTLRPQPTPSASLGGHHHGTAGGGEPNAQYRKFRDPLAMDLGSVPVGSRRAYRLVVRNRSNAKLALDVELNSLPFLSASYIQRQLFSAGIPFVIELAAEFSEVGEWLGHISLTQVDIYSSVRGASVQVPVYVQVTASV